MDSIGPDSFQVYIEEANKALDSPLTPESEVVINDSFKTLSEMKGLTLQNTMKLMALACRIQATEGAIDSQMVRIDSIALPIIHQDLRYIIGCFLDNQKLFQTLKYLNIPAKERCADLNAVARFIKEGMRGCDVANILKAIATIPAVERDDVLNAAMRLIKEEMSGYTVVDILKDVAATPEEKREGFVNAAARLIKEEMSGDDVVAILKVIVMISAKKRESFVNAAARLIKEEMTGSDIVSILRVVAVIPEGRRESSMNAAARFINEEMSLADIKLLISRFSDLPETSPTDYSHLIYSLVGKRGTSEDICFFVDFIKGTRCLKSTKEEFYEALTQKLVSLVSTASLSKKTREDAVYMAQIVLYHQDLLEITDDSPLVDAAIRTILWLEGDKSDVYYVHAHMKATRSQCEAPLEQMIKPVSIVLSEPKGKVSVTLRLQGLQEALVGLQKKRKDYLGLKTWIAEVNHEKKPTDPSLGPKIFIDLFRDLKARLDLEILANPANSAELEELMANASRVEDNLTNLGFLTAELMSAPFGADEVLVPKLTEKLYAIGAALLKEDNTPSQKGGLSPREELMMSALLMIEHCSEGQEGGITACYNGLKAAQKIPGKVEESNIHPGVEKTKEYLASELQKIMEEVLAAPETLRQLGVTQEGAFDQGVHQSKYLKNILGKECGLNHSTSLDPHGGFVSRSLMAHSRETIVGVFFQELSQTLVSSLKRDFNSLAKEPRAKLYNDLTDFFTQHKVNLERAWSIERGDVELTEFGALELLEKGGCLIPLSGKYKHYLDLEDKLKAKEEELHQIQSVKVVDPKAIEEAKNNKKNLEQVYMRAARTKDSTVSQAKEAFEKANVQVEELLAQEKLSKEASSRISLLVQVIKVIETELASSRDSLKVESEIPEVRPPIPVIQDSLIQGTLPADIQDLEAKWKIAENSLTNRKEILLNYRDDLYKASKKANVQGIKGHVDRLENEVSKLSKEVRNLKEVFLKAREEYLGH